MPGRELVSLHLGSLACHTGSHFWNLQDELAGYVDHPDLGPLAATVDLSSRFAEVPTARGGSAWRPRALFVDLSGALGGVNVGTTANDPRSSSAAAQQGVASWSGGVELHAAPRIPKSRFVEQLEREAEDARLRGWDGGDAEDEAQHEAQARALEEAARELSGAAGAGRGAGQDGPAGARFWTDYLKVELAPKSVYTLPGVWQGVNDFAGYGDGEGVVRDGSPAAEELSDRLRAAVEDCDSLQGFHVMVDDLSGWGGVAARVLQEVNEDYGGGAGRPCLLFALRSSDVDTPGATSVTPAYARLRSSLNESLALSRLVELVSLYVPLSLPATPTRRGTGLAHISCPHGSRFHAAAVMAAAIDTALLPLAYTGYASPLGPAAGGLDLHSLAGLLRGGQRGCPLAALALSLPLPDLAPPTPQAGAGAEELVLERMAGLQQLTHLTPGIRFQPGMDVAESLSVRGGRLAAAADGPAPTSAVMQALDGLLVAAAPRRCVSHRGVCPLPLLVPLPFPSTLWGANVGPNGRLATRTPAAVPAGLPDVRTCATMTRLYGTQQFEASVQQVADGWLRDARSGPGAALLDHWGVDRSGVDDTAESLRQLAGLYHAGDGGHVDDFA